MVRKRNVERPYRPAYCSAETLAYLLDLSRSTLDDYVRLGHIPEPLFVGSSRKWRWVDVDTFILARNGRAVDDDATSDGLLSAENDPFRRGIANAKAAQG